MPSRRDFPSLKRPSGTWALALCIVLVLPACDFFATRTPEAPIDEAGTFVQPATPDQVIENVQYAVAELNEQNYRRSLAEGFRFVPAPEAAARDPSIWAAWTVQDEASYFRAMAGAARLTTGNELRLTDGRLSAITDARFAYEASYLLIVNHRRTGLPSAFQGRLAWTIDQGDDALWRVTEWSDREIGTAMTWSDLKAEFIK